MAFDAGLRVAIPSVVKLLKDGQIGVRSSAAFILDNLGHGGVTTDINGTGNEASEFELDVFHGASPGARKGGRRRIAMAFK